MPLLRNWCFISFIPYRYRYFFRTKVNLGDKRKLASLFTFFKPTKINTCHLFILFFWPLCILGLLTITECNAVLVYWNINCLSHIITPRVQSLHILWVLFQQARHSNFRWHFLFLASSANKKLYIEGILTILFCRLTYCYSLFIYEFFSLNCSEEVFSSAEST